MCAFESERVAEHNGGELYLSVNAGVKGQLNAYMAAPPRRGGGRGGRGRAAAGAAEGAARWLRSTSDGYCEATQDGYEGDCSIGDKGAFGLSSRDKQTWAAAARACVARCLECARCEFISVRRTRAPPQTAIAARPAANATSLLHCARSRSSLATARGTADATWPG